MKKCVRCGKECNDNTVFCTNCGEKFAQDEQAFYIGHEDVKKGNGKLLAILLPIIGVLLIVIIVLAVIFIPKFINLKSNVEPSPVPTEEPTAEPTEAPDLKVVDMEEIYEIISQDANGADFSVSIIDLENERYYDTANSHNSMSASALINVPVLYTAYQETKNGYLSLDDSMEFTYYGDGRKGELEKNQDGDYFSVEYIMQQILNYSDNNATNSLVDYLGRDYIENVCDNNSYLSVDLQKRLGEDADYKDNYISARDVTEMLAEIYNSTDNYYINKDYLLDNFRIYDDASRNGAGRYLPSSVTFLNHNAVTSKIYNEVAIIRGDGFEYIITIMSNNGKMEDSSYTAAKISSYVYDALN